VDLEKTIVKSERQVGPDGPFLSATPWHKASVSKKQRAMDAEALVRRYLRRPDERTKAAVVQAYQRLVYRFAYRFLERGEPLDDLIQVGNVGLLLALERYDGAKKIQFATFATATIVGELQRYFRDKTVGMRMPRPILELTAKLATAQNELANSLGRSPRPMEIADELGVPEETVLEALEALDIMRVLSLESALPGKSDDAGSALNIEDVIGRNDEDMARLVRYDDLWWAFERLDHRLRKIIWLEYVEDYKQVQIANIMKISQMHVSRLRRKALEHLRDRLTTPV